MSGQANGGVFNPKNLNLYTYTYNNPINLVDPDGNNPKIIGDFALNLAIAYATEGKLSWSAVRGAAVETAKDAVNPMATVNKMKKLAGVIKKFKNSQGTTLNLKYKSNWTKEQKTQADMKAKQLTESLTVVTKKKAKRSGTQSRFRKKANLDKNTDADHIVELQLGGKDVMENMQSLDGSVNKSFGKQIQNAIKDLPDGTKVGKVKIK